MALRAILDNLTLPELGAKLRQYHAASAQGRLLASIDTTLVLFGDELINSANGEIRRLPAEDGLSMSGRIARAARSLLPGTGAHILLLLPPTDFIGTRFALGVQGESLLRSALSLQVASLLPAYDKPLLLALNGQRGEGIALWYPEEHANSLYQAFTAEGLALVALQPRVLAAGTMLEGRNGTLSDEGEYQLTQVVLEQGVVRAWSTVHRSDLDNTIFREQWQAELEGLEQGSRLALQREYWGSLRVRVQPLPAYCFFPAGAITRGKQLLAMQQRKAAALAAAVIVGVLILPFASNWVRSALLEREVAALQDASAQARRSQAAVYDMDDTWGPLAEYPQQDVATLLLTLDGLIDNSLSSFVLNKGVIDISGYSPDPALLIEQISEQELFYNVGQSRGTSGSGASNRGDQFGIRINVSGVDFPAYESKYELDQD